MGKKYFLSLIARFKYLVYLCGVNKQNMIMEKTFSFDAETDGLWGRVFAVAASVRENGKEIDTFYGRVAVELQDEWTKTNVPPGDVTHENYYLLIKDFAAFYMQHKNSKVIAHVAFPVEAGLLREMHNFKFIGDWDAPYPLIDVANILLAKGHNPLSVEDYAKEKGLTFPEGSAHDPLYDSRVTAIVYEHLMEG